jgi:hypothetical protein
LWRAKYHKYFFFQGKPKSTIKTPHGVNLSKLRDAVADLPSIVAGEF